MSEQAAKKQGDLVINIAADAIRGTEIMRSGEYKYARVGAKLGENEFVSVTYEWKGEGYVPDAVMALMAYIKANKDDMAMNEEEFASIVDRHQIRLSEGWKTAQIED